MLQAKACGYLNSPFIPPLSKGGSKKGVLKRVAATIAEISLRARLTRVAEGLRGDKAPRMGYRK